MTYGVIFCHDKKFHFFANLTRVCCSSKTTISLLQFYTRCFGKAWICHCHDATMKVQFSFLPRKNSSILELEGGNKLLITYFYQFSPTSFSDCISLPNFKKRSFEKSSFLRSNIFRLFDFVAYSDIWIFALKITLKILGFQYFEFKQKILILFQ